MTAPWIVVTSWLRPKSAELASWRTLALSAVALHHGGDVARLPVRVAENLVELHVDARA
jgi:hypothetical protein